MDKNERKQIIVAKLREKINEVNDSQNDVRERLQEILRNSAEFHKLQKMKLAINKKQDELNAETNILDALKSETNDKIWKTRPDGVSAYNISTESVRNKDDNQWVSILKPVVSMKSLVDTWGLDKNNLMEFLTTNRNNPEMKSIIEVAMRLIIEDDMDALKDFMDM